MSAPSRQLPPAYAPTTASRLRYRADVAVAARVITQSWPLSTFIAVNPLAGLEHLPFAHALALAGDFYGACGTLSEPQFREQHAAGRITDGDLAGALYRRLGPIDGQPLVLGDSTLTPLRVLIADLIVGIPATPPERRILTSAEHDDPAVATQIDSHCAQWCAAYCDEGQAAFRLPGRENGLYAAWRRLASRDRSLPSSARTYLRRLPESSEAAALVALAELGISLAHRIPYLQAHLTRMPGWAGHLRWRSEHVNDNDLLNYLTLRLCYEAALTAGGARAADRQWQPTPVQAPEAADARSRARRVAWSLAIADATEGQLSACASVLQRLPVDARCQVWLDAYEAHYSDALLRRLSGKPAAGAERLAAQVVFCIDVRSEGLRRQLEAHGNYETLGFAGFFAAAISFTDVAGGSPSAQCPVLLEPKNAVAERAVTPQDRAIQRHLAGLHAISGAQESFHSAKESSFGSFTLAESTGWLAGPLAAARTVAPRGYDRLRSRLGRAIAPPAATELTVREGFTFDERCLLAKAALTMMGLTTAFARLVVLCGHGSSTENNPYASALDCGACGGNRGAANARAAAAILNEGAVRAYLESQGITVPADTWFLAAEHDTASDQLRILDAWRVPPTHHADLARLQDAAAASGATLSDERCADLPGAGSRPSPARAARHVQRRSADWAQVFPEWGLAGNAAFIVGPRSLTYGMDLQRRTFLHSYNPDVDADGTALETILTAPLVVAQWINCQYYFSAVEPEIFGAGTKTIHNVVGGVGVLSGHNGDLQAGLPRQSVGVGNALMHEPMRLLAVVQAPLARIDGIVERNVGLRNLIVNGWIALVAREHLAQPWQRRTATSWEPWFAAQEAGQ